MIWPRSFIVTIGLAIIRYSTNAVNNEGARDWYVSFRGDVTDFKCGAQTSPCRYIDHVIDIAGEFDVIHIEAQQTFNANYSLTMGDGPVTKLWKTLHLVGYNGVPRILLVTTDEKKEQNDLGKTEPVPGIIPACSVKLERISLVGGVISFGICSAILSQVTFFNVRIAESNNLLVKHIFIKQSDFHGLPQCPSGGLCDTNIINKIICHKVNLTIHSSKFYNTLIKVSAKEGHGSVIKVFDSYFGSNASHISSMGGLNVYLNRKKSTIMVKNCTFEHLIHPTIVKTATNLFEAALQLRVSSKSRLDNATSAILTVEDCVFFNNERGFTAIGGWNSVALVNCKFQQNIAMNAGAGILQLTDITTRISVVGCRFSSNQAGSLRVLDTQDTPGTVHVQNKEVHVDHDCCKGVITMKGEGGAIRVQKGKMDIINCTFTNNTAHLMGGSVMVDMDGQVEIRDSRFQNSPDLLLSEQGDILYSRGKVLMSGVVFDVQSTTNGVSLVKHHGNHWSLDVTKVFFQCPAGFNTRATYGVTSARLTHSYRLDDLTYSCQSCPLNQFSQDRGYLSNTITPRIFDNVTYTIGGAYSNASIEAVIKHHVISCKDCPADACPVGQTSGFTYIRATLCPLTLLFILYHSML